MNVKMNDILTITIFVLIVYIIFMHSCRNNNTGNLSTIDTTFVFDTIVKSFPVFYPIEKEIIKNDTLIINYQDTIFIKETIEDYYSTKIYLDSLKNDSILAIIESKVNENEIKEQKLSYKILFPTQTIIQNKENKVKFFFGATLGTNGESFFIGGKITLIDKKDLMYHAGASYSPIEMKPFFNVGIDYKLKFNK